VSYCQFCGLNVKGIVEQNRTGSWLSNYRTAICNLRYSWYLDIRYQHRVSNQGNVGVGVGGYWVFISPLYFADLMAVEIGWRFS